MNIIPNNVIIPYLLFRINKNVSTNFLKQFLFQNNNTPTLFSSVKMDYGVY